MEGEEIEAVMERAWDLHDKISDAIHSLSKYHFVNSIRKQNNQPHPVLNNPPPYNPPPPHSCFRQDDPIRDNTQTLLGHSQIYNGAPAPTERETECDYSAPEGDLFAETRSLNDIRNALESLENQLHFLHTLQLQQRAERDAALMRLEESRLMLLKRLREHRGRDLTVIKEALAFATDADDAEDVHINPKALQKSAIGEGNKALIGDKTTTDLQGKCQIGLAYFLGCGIRFVKSDRLHAVAGVVAKVALVAVSMLAIFQLRQTSQRTTRDDSRSKAYRIQNSRQYTRHQSETNVEDYFGKNPVGERTELYGRDSFTSLDVLFGRG